MSAHPKIPIRGLNHITLAVSDLTRSVSFYQGILGFALVKQWPSGAYFDVNGLWFCLSSDRKCRQVPHLDYSHLAFDLDPESFSSWTAHLKQHEVKVWKDNLSEGNSLYFLDPDGHKLELHVGDLKSRLSTMP